MADETTESPSGPVDQDSERVRWIIGESVVPYDDRTTARQVLVTDGDVQERNYSDILDSDNPQVALGSDSVFAVDLTHDEAAQWLSDDHVRYVDPDSEAAPTTAAGSTIPATPIATSSLSFMRASTSSFPDAANWHGRDSIVAVLDQGTTAAARTALGVTLVARSIFGDDPSPSEIFAGQNHGCLVMSCAVPPGGKLLDAMIISSNGLGRASSAMAAMRWAAQNGANVINLSFGGFAESQGWTDVINYLNSMGVQLFVSAANDGVNFLPCPANYSRTMPNVHSSIAFDEAANYKASFSNYAVDCSGCAPGVGINMVTFDGSTVQANGTSFSSPLMALLVSMGTTNKKFTPQQVGTALKNNTRNTGQPRLFQGGGAYDLRRALAALGAATPALPQRNLAITPSAEFDVPLQVSTARGAGASTPVRDNSVAADWGLWHWYTKITKAGTFRFDGPTFAVVAGQQYAISVACFRPKKTTSVPTVVIRWLSSTGAELSLSYVTTGNYPNDVGMWNRLVVSGTAPTNAVAAQGYVNNNTGAVNDEYRIDSWLYQFGTDFEPYFDGSYAHALWDGTPGASSSRLSVNTDPASRGTPQSAIVIEPFRVPDRRKKNTGIRVPTEKRVV